MSGFAVVLALYVLAQLLGHAVLVVAAPPWRRDRHMLGAAAALLALGAALLFT